MADVSDRDRGWSFLSAGTQRREYGGDQASYLADVNAVDWSQVAWAPARGYVDDGVAYTGDVALLSHPSTLPQFLIERRHADALCVDGLPFGIMVYMTVGWFSTSHPGAGAGATGSQLECRRAFDELAGPWHAPFDLVGGAWGTPRGTQRVGVLDGSGLVAALGVGREDPPLDAAIRVEFFSPRSLAVAWQGSSCDANSTLRVDGDPTAFTVIVERLTRDGCSGMDRAYEVVFELSAEVPLHAVSARLSESSTGR